MTGTWAPAVSTTAVGTITYTFTPTAGLCATTTTLDITVSGTITPTFAPIASVCQNATAPVLPTISTNGVTGTWAPAVSTSTVGTATYTFTPSSSPCATTTTLDITVLAPTAPTFAPIADVCQNATAPILPTTSTNGVTGTWAPAVSTTAVGTITYTFTPTAGLCATTTTLDITVLAPTVPTFAPITSVCLNATAPILPTTSTNGIAGTWSPVVSTAISGLSTYTFTPTAGQCASTTTLDINVIVTPTLNAIADVANCGSYALPAISGTNLTGNEAYYNNSQATGGTVITGPITTTQTVWVYDGNTNCSSELSFVVTINPLPSVSSIVGGGTYCQGDVINDIVVNVTGNPNWTVNYTLDGVAQSATSGTNPIVLGNTTGVYQLIDIADANCSSPVTGLQTIVVNPIPPAPVLSADAVFCTTAIIDFMSGTGSVGGTLYWYDDVSLNLSNLIGSGPTANPNNTLGTTTYYVQDDNLGCLSPVSTIQVTIDDCNVIVPTAFTPDGDLNNDTWEIPGLDASYPNNIVRIYNRWGNLIFEHVSSLTVPYSGNQWDGTYKGNMMPVGSYYYIIETNDSDTEVLKGTITIILNK